MEMEENFAGISYRPNLCLGLESRRNTFWDIIVFLKDENIRWTGVHGMGGVGKTTLIKEVARYADEEGLFDKIVWSDVSPEADVSIIQDQIATAFGFSLDPKGSQQTKAQQIRVTLTKHSVKKVLIILDDVWDIDHLLSIGFPDSMSDLHVACKVLSTSRNKETLRNANLIIPVEALPKEEAFILFNQIVGQTESPDLVGEIVDTCEGLPLIIETVAHKLRGQPLSEWELALQTLRRSVAEFDDGILSCIKLSYDYLGTQTAKFMFLLCGFLGELISRTEIGKCTYHLGSFENSIDKTLAENYLKSTCLLQDEEYLSMSKICRDVAIKIACSDPNWFIVRKDSGAIEWPENDKLARVRYMSLHVSNIDMLEFPQGTMFPNLELLRLYDGNVSFEIADNFFMGMNKRGPKILAMIKMKLLSLPSSLLVLTNLDALYLDFCMLDDISMIGKLRNLESLSLSHTNIEQLPVQIRQLKSLEILNLGNCLNLKVIPPDVFSRLTRLKVLIMEKSFSNWRVEGVSDFRRNASLAEFIHLKYLVDVCIHIPDADMIPDDLPWNNWDRYRITIGQDLRYFSKHETSKTIILNDAKRVVGRKHRKIKRKLVWGCEEIWLKEFKGFKKILSELDSGGFQSLKHLYIQDNAELEYIGAENQTGRRFRNLESLVLRNLMNFRVIHKGIKFVAYFQNLRILRIKDCPSLSFVWKTEARECLPHLTELEVKSCGGMTAVVVNDKKPPTFFGVDLSGLQSLKLQNLDNLFGFCICLYLLDMHGRKGLIHKVNLPNLKHMKLVKLPKVSNLDTDSEVSLENLETLEIDGCNELSQLFNNEQDVLLPGLRHLRLRNLRNLDCITGSNRLQRRTLNFKSLTRLTVRNCNQLKYLLPHYVLQNLEQLPNIEISDCPMLEQVFFYEDDTVMTESQKRLLPLFLSLKLTNLPQLASICSGAPHLVSLHDLNKITIEDCPKLTFAHLQITSIKNTKQMMSFPSILEDLNLHQSNHLEIICKDLLSSSMYLKSLELYGCNYLEYLFSLSMAQSLSFLQELKIISCKRVEQIIRRELEGTTTTTNYFVNFPELSTLILENLPEFTKFCSLKLLRVFECPKIEISTLGMVDRSILKSTEGIDCKPMGNGDSTSNIANLDKLLVNLPRLKHLKLVKLPRLSNLDISNKVSPKNLETLEIDECNELSQIFNGEQDVLLPQLCQLRLQNLHNWECITGSNHLQRTLNSKRLNQLIVCNCKNLKYLLPHYVLKNLVNLQKIALSDCAILEQVFVFEEDTEKAESSNNMVLPALHSLELVNLPKLASICSAVRRLSLQLRHMTIKHCPNLTSTFGHLERESVENDPHMGKFEEKITVPSLFSNLNLCQSNHLKSICKDHFFSFTYLRSLKLYGCNHLEYLFSLSVARRLSILQELEIISCKMFEQIIKRELGLTTTANYIIEFPEVSTLILESLPEFIRFCPNDYTIKWPSLKLLRVVKCPKIKKTLLGVVDYSCLQLKEVIDCNQWDLQSTNELLQLKDLNIEDSEELKTYINRELTFSSFTNLMKLKATKCDNELNKLLSILLSRAQTLEQLTVEKCELLEQVFELGGFDPEGNGRFPNLNTMILSDLPKLNYIWNKDPSGIIDLRRLVKLEIIKCGSLRNLVSIAVVEKLVQLKELHIDSCEMIEEVVTINIESEEMEKHGRWFPEMTNLRLQGLPNFIKFNSEDWKFRFPKLQSLTIEHCPRMNVFTSGLVHRNQIHLNHRGIELRYDAYPKLQILKLVGVKTCEIWQGCDSTESFHEIIELELDKSNNVEYIFPSSIFPALIKLETLVVRDCSSLSDVFQVQRTDKIMQQSVAPVLRKLVLSGLPTLKHVFGNDSIHIVLQNLEIIQVKSCDSLQQLSLPSSCYKLKEIEIFECKNLEKIFTDTEAEKTNPEIPAQHLEYVILGNLPKLSHFSLETFEIRSLFVASIEGCPALNTFIPGPAVDNFFTNLDSFQELKEVSLINVGGSLKNIWNNHINDLSSSSLPGCHRMALLPQLKKLVLTDLPYMELWKQEPEIAVFRNLTSIEIIRCGSIKGLFSISVAANLGILKFLKLYDCKSMQQVLHGRRGNSKNMVAAQVGGEVKKILFKNLKSLILKSLPNLTSFCEEECEFEFPKLEMVRLKDNPNMKTFAKGCVTTPKLKEVYITHITKCWQPPDLNATIQYIHANQGKLKTMVEGGRWKTCQMAPTNNIRHTIVAAESLSEVV